VRIILMPPPVDPELATMQLREHHPHGREYRPARIVLSVQAAVGGNRHHIENRMAQRRGVVGIGALEVQEQGYADAAHGEHAQDRLGLGVAEIGPHAALAPGEKVGGKIQCGQDLNAVSTISMGSELKCPMLAS
jgi:hypothetical protein